MQSSFEGSRSTLKGDSLDRSALVVQSRGHGHGRGGGRGGQVTCYGYPEAIGRGRVSNGLYLLDEGVSHAFAASTIPMTQKGYRFFSPDLGQYLDFANVSFVEDRSFFVEYESSLYLCHLKLKPHVKLHQRILNLYQYFFQHLQILLHNLISLLHFVKFGMVCRLRKLLYGLMQSPRSWFGRFSGVVLAFGLKLSQSDHTVFYKNTNLGSILLVVYVDDIVITRSDNKGTDNLKSFLQTQFQTIDLGALKYFLGIEVMYSKKGIPMDPGCDNEAATHIESNPIYHERMKHIEVDCHLILEKVQQNLICTSYVKTGDQLADVLTKALNGGVLSDGTVVAVKQLSARSRQGSREFVNEIGLISALQHPCLVKLYGCCMEEDQLLLIYEYMENNSLAHALFAKNDDSEKCQLRLDWQTRHRICVGIAKGLAYLHEESKLKIVHRDIKANNVLLDKDLNPKISDFGLAKLNDGDKTHLSTRIAGTYGYIAPEYAMHGYLTDKADVYSFGIVALEIVSGMSNTISQPTEECFSLIDRVHLLKENGNLMEIVDKRLGEHFNKTEAMMMINVALLCTKVSLALRPTMSLVVSMLEGRTHIQEVVLDKREVLDDVKF
ncbi:putative LRR receptor-like serine/threonine-protein kinase isoform B [Glycine soja]|uniref:Putative LRR receptor-like serine/threonine-protein kinase isoform B n=1 Tax=Glycine soja TaxID=3848 RepID=A0A445M1Z9_GLYSO|nr:putative LRR receptor-like serine/threonine-protein kinase isoform B [Glycine soja]